MVIDDLQAMPLLAPGGLPPAFMDRPRARPGLHIVAVDASGCRRERTPVVDEDGLTVGCEHSDGTRGTEHLGGLSLIHI